MLKIHSTLLLNLFFVSINASYVKFFQDEVNEQFIKPAKINQALLRDINHKVIKRHKLKNPDTTIIDSYQTAYVIDDNIAIACPY